MNVSLWVQSLIDTLAGVILGALIAWLISHVYASRATKHMTRQRDELQRYNRVLTALFQNWEEQGLVELSRDPEGEITGGHIRSGLTTSAGGSSGTGAGR